MGAEKVLAMLKRAQSFCGSLNAGHLNFSHDEVGGGAKTFRGGGHKKFFPVSRGGPKSFGPANFPFSIPPLPVINDWSLTVRLKYYHDTLI